MNIPRLMALFAILTGLAAMSGTAGTARATTRSEPAATPRGAEEPGQPHVIGSPTSPNATAVRPLTAGGKIALDKDSVALPLASAVAHTSAANETYIYEGFEDWPNYIAGGTWTLRDYSDSDGGQYFWGARDCIPYAGNFGGFTAGGGSNGDSRSCTSKYPRNARSAAFLGPFDLTDVTSATMSLVIRGQSEWNFNPDGTCDASIDDYAFIGVGIPSSPTNLPGPEDLWGWCQAGNYSDFDTLTFDLKVLEQSGHGVLGRDNVYVGIYFSSDSDDTRFPGLSFDELLITLSHNPKPAPPSPKLFVPVATRAPAQQPIEPCPDIEPNDVPAQAKLVTSLGQTCSGSLQSDSDDDWYAVDVTQGKTINLDLTNIPAGADFDLYLFEQVVATDATKGLVGTSDLGGNADEHISHLSTKSQRYYIRILIRNKAGDNSYHLRVGVD